MTGIVTCTQCGGGIFSPQDMKKHPVLNVPQCLSCNVSYCQVGDLTQYRGGVDRQGKDNYCRWCLDGGDLVMCLDDNCRSSFCHNCIERNFGLKRFNEIQNSQDWYCFVCDYTQLDSLRKDDPIPEIKERKKLRLNLNIFSTTALGRKPRESVPKPTPEKVPKPHVEQEPPQVPHVPATKTIVEAAPHLAAPKITIKQNKPKLVEPTIEVVPPPKEAPTPVAPKEVASRPTPNIAPLLSTPKEKVPMASPTVVQPPPKDTPTPVAPNVVAPRPTPNILPPISTSKEKVPIPPITVVPPLKESPIPVVPKDVAPRPIPNVVPPLSTSIEKVPMASPTVVPPPKDAAIPVAPKEVSLKPTSNIVPSLSTSKEKVPMASPTVVQPPKEAPTPVVPKEVAPRLARNIVAPPSTSKEKVTTQPSTVVPPPPPQTPKQAVPRPAPKDVTPRPAPLKWALKDAAVIKDRVAVHLETLQTTLNDYNEEEFVADPASLFSWIRNLKTFLNQSQHIIDRCTNMDSYSSTLKRVQPSREKK